MTKKIIAFVLVCVMCLCLFACSSKEADLYNKYKDIIDALEEEDYQSAYLAMVELSNKGDTDENGEETKDPAIEEFKASVVGNWIPSMYSVEEHSAVSFELTNSGKFIMGEDAYPLEVNYESKDSVTYDAVDGETKVYRININKNENGMFSAYLGRYNGDQSTNGIGTYYLESQYTKIELTADNFAEYFEDVPEYVEYSENSFDEVTSFTVYRDIALKEEYGTVNTELSEVALEYNYTSTYYNYTADISAGTYQIGEVREGYEITESTSTTSMGSWHGPDDDRYGFNFGSLYFGSEEGWQGVYSDFSLVRIMGTVYAYNGK